MPILPKLEYQGKLLKHSSAVCALQRGNTYNVSRLTVYKGLHSSLFKVIV